MEYHLRQSPHRFLLVKLFSLGKKPSRFQFHQTQLTVEYDHVWCLFKSHGLSRRPFDTSRQNPFIMISLFCVMAHIWQSRTAYQYCAISSITDCAATHSLGTLSKEKCKIQQQTKKKWSPIWLSCYHLRLSFWRGATAAGSNQALASHSFLKKKKKERKAPYPKLFIMHRWKEVLLWTTNTVTPISFISSFAPTYNHVHSQGFANHVSL